MTLKFSSYPFYKEEGSMLGRRSLATFAILLAVIASLKPANAG